MTSLIKISRLETKVQQHTQAHIDAALALLNPGADRGANSFMRFCFDSFIAKEWFPAMPGDAHPFDRPLTERMELHATLRAHVKILPRLPDEEVRKLFLALWLEWKATQPVPQRTDETK